MTRQLDDFLKTFTPAEGAEIQTRARALIEDELTLRALRQAHDLTQERMAELLGVKQENISRMERRADLLLSTMSSYIEAMGVPPATPHFREAIHASTCSSSTSSGTGPDFSTVSWKPRMSNFLPSPFCALSRSSLIFRRPTM